MRGHGSIADWLAYISVVERMTPPPLLLSLSGASFRGCLATPTCRAVRDTTTPFRGKEGGLPSWQISSFFRSGSKWLAMISLLHQGGAMWQASRRQILLLTSAMLGPGHGHVSMPRCLIHDVQSVRHIYTWTVPMCHGGALISQLY